MATKGEKIKPVVLPDELYEMCNWKEEPLLQQLHNGLEKCKTVYEEMNCFGLLKQEIQSSCSMNVIRFISLAYILPSCQALHKSTSVLLSMLCKNMEESVHVIYGEIAEKLISIHFHFSFEESTLEAQIDLWSNWLSLPHLQNSFSVSQGKSILLYFYPICRQFVNHAMESQAVEYQQQQISLATMILRNCYLLCQAHSQILSEMNRQAWFEIVMDIMKTYCVLKEDCVGVSQLWLEITRYEKQSIEKTIESLESLLKQSFITSELHILLYRELFLQVSFMDLFNSSSHFIENIVKDLCSLITTDSEEIVCIMQTCCLLFSLFKEHQLTVPADSIQQVIEFIILYLDSTVRKLSRMSEDCLLQIIQSISTSQYNQYVQPILQQYIMNNQISRKLFSILNVLLQCESAFAIFKIHPSLIQFLLSQLTERNSSLCSQITSVLITLFLRLYEELGKERRKEWYSLCIDPIIDVIFTNKSKNCHIFNYVLPSLLNIKSNLLSKTLQEEYKQVQQKQEGYEESIFSLSYYFIHQIKKQSDKETSALFVLNILKVNKQAGLIGKEMGDYLGEESIQLSMKLAKEYAQCGHDEIRLCLFDLICSSLYTTLPLCQQEWDLLLLLLENCYQSDNPHYRHEICVCFTRLCNRLLAACSVVLKKYKKLSPSSIHGLFSHTDLLENSKELQACQIAYTNLLQCYSLLLNSITISSPTHSLLILTDLLQIILSMFTKQSSLPLSLDYSEKTIETVLLLISNQNNQIRENGITIFQSLFTVMTIPSIDLLLQGIVGIALREDGMLTDYEVDITASHLSLLYDCIEQTQWKGWCKDTTSFDSSSILIFSKASNECSVSELFLLYLMNLVQLNNTSMHQSASLPFIEYPLPTCQGILRGLILICTKHSTLLENISLFRYLLFLFYHIYHESLTIIADTAIFTPDENEGDDLLAKGPIQVQDEGLITKEDHIAKNKLDCRGHIIGETDEKQTKQLKKLMLTAWLLCKHSSLGISSLLSLLPDTKFSSCETIPTTEDLSQLDSYLKEDAYQATSIKQWLTSNDILYLVWNLLSSVLTIKHIGGIIYVANAITLILQRLTHIANQSVFIASLPSFLISILLDEENINNRNFILRRSTGYSTAICAILSSSPALVKSVLCRLFLVAAPSIDYFSSLPASCYHPSLFASNEPMKTTWKSRVHALNILRQIYLDRTIEIQDHFYEPALMLAIEGLCSSVWQVKNSGLMLYTVIVKKLLSNRVNDNVSEKNLNITSFFIKYPFLRHWFSYKLDLIQSTHEEEFGTAGLNPVLFAFIVLTSRLSGCTSSIEDEWILHITQVVSEVNSSSNLFCRTMSARALSILIPLQDHSIYAEFLIKHILTYSLSQNEIHGILLQLLFILKIAAQRNDVGTIHAIITHFMNNTEIIFGKLRVDFVKFTFFEIVAIVIEYTSQYDHVLSFVIMNQLRSQTGTIGDILCIRTMVAILVTLSLRLPVRGIEDERLDRGLIILKKCFTEIAPHEIVLALKRLRQFYHRLDSNQRSSLYTHYFTEITKVLCNQITSQNLPRFAMKAYLKTVVLLYDYLPSLSNDSVHYLLSLVSQTDNMEIAYWATRFITCCISKKCIDSSIQEECEKAIIHVISHLDITLSYRTMLADICLISSQVTEQQSILLYSLSLVIACMLAEDSNPSIQQTILSFIQKKGGFAGITIGVNEAYKIIHQQFLSNTLIPLSFCKVTIALLIPFIHNNQPASIIAEMEEIYKNDSSCAIPVVVIHMFKDALQQVSEEEREELVKPLKECLKEWKEKKEGIEDGKWEGIEMKPSDKYLILKLLNDLFYECLLQTVNFF